MSQTRLFLTKLTYLIMVIALLLGGLFILVPPDPSAFFASSSLKMDLLRDTPSPRVLIMGGSNVVFAINSERMKDELGLPVVNTGLHGEVVINSMREMQPYIRKGDIVVVMLEYELFASQNALDGNDFFIAQWVEYDLNRLRLFDSERDMKLLQTIISVKFTRGLTYLLGMDFGRGVFVRANFNAQGDFIGHLLAPPVEEVTRNSSYISPRDYYAGTYAFLEQFNQAALAKGAIVLYEFPASRATNCQNTGLEAFQTYYNVFREKTTIPIITPFDTNQICLPDSMFYDTIYHVNGEGREVLTSRIIRDLSPYLPK
jgi:hypothetical protein